MIARWITGPIAYPSSKAEQTILWFAAGWISNRRFIKLTNLQYSVPQQFKLKDKRENNELEKSRLCWYNLVS